MGTFNSSGYSSCIYKEVVSCFSERLRKVRTDSGLTQQEFADEIGIAVATLSNYETGKRVPDIVFLQKIHEYFLIPVDYFLGNTGSRKKDNSHISNKLGLSDEAIEKMKSYADEVECYAEPNRNVLSRLLETEEFYNILRLLTLEGWQCDEYLAHADEDYFSYVVTKKVIRLIADVANTKAKIRGRIVASALPDQKKREAFYRWELEQIEESSKQYQQIETEIKESALASVERYKAQNSARIEALEKLKRSLEESEPQAEQEAPKHGEHHTQT